MSDQLELDLDGYCPPASTATTTTSGNISGSTTGGTVKSISIGGTSVWYSIPSGTLPPPLPPIIGIDYGTKPAAPKEKNKDGCTCKKCQEFFPYAESNQDDGTLICYGCKLWM